MEITENEKLVLIWLYTNKPKRFSVNNRKDLSEDFIDMFLWGPMVGNPKNIYNVLSDLSTKNLIELDSDGYFLKNNGLRIIQDIIEQENDEQIDKGLNRKKLWYETENAKKMFDDYPSTKKQARWAIWIAGIAALAALIQMLLQLREK